MTDSKLFSVTLNYPKQFPFIRKISGYLKITINISAVVYKMGRESDVFKFESKFYLQPVMSSRSNSLKLSYLYNGDNSNQSMEILKGMFITALYLLH